MLIRVSRPLKTASALRAELSHRNALRTTEWVAELSYSPIPNIVYAETESGTHGNFLAASYKRIVKHPAWKERLAKVYSGSRFIPRQADRIRRELECANSSDALLMNIFCYPGIMHRPALCSLLAIAPKLKPEFGIRPAIPLKKGTEDRSEVDLQIANLFVEAKLTEGDFQTARLDLVHRYRDLETIFDVSRLKTTSQQPGRSQPRYRSCQLIRGALAAHAHAASFAVFCDTRRPDLIEDCFETFSAINNAELRCRMSVVTWQELAATLPRTLRLFLEEKYGILATGF